MAVKKFDYSDAQNCTVGMSKWTLMRLPKIKEGLMSGMTQLEIAELCGVSRRTISCDIQCWVESREFESWLKSEFVELYGKTKVDDPIQAFRELSKIVSRMVTSKREVQEDINVKRESTSINLNMEEMNSEAVSAMVKNYLERESRRLRQRDDGSLRGAVEDSE